MRDVVVISEDDEGGPILSLPDGEHTAALRLKLVEKYHRCVADLIALREGEGRYQANEQPLFAPLRYRIALLGKLLKEGKVATFDIFRLFIKEDNNVFHPQLFEEACREIENDTTGKS